VRNLRQGAGPPGFRSDGSARRQPRKTLKGRRRRDALHRPVQVDEMPRSNPAHPRRKGAENPRADRSCGKRIDPGLSIHPGPHLASWMRYPAPATLQEEKLKAGSPCLKDAADRCRELKPGSRVRPFVDGEPKRRHPSIRPFISRRKRPAARAADQRHAGCGGCGNASATRRRDQTCEEPLKSHERCRSRAFASNCWDR
jgi:hypothetical protein